MRVVLLSLSLLAACNPPPPPAAVPGDSALATDGEVLMTVNGRKVTDKMMSAVTRNTPDFAIEQRKATGLYAKLVEQVGVGEVLYQAALDDRIHEDPEVQVAIAMNAREVLAQEYFSRKINERVTDGAVQQYYDDRAVQYKRPQAHAAHILVKDQALANEIVAKANAGEDFAALAEQYSEDTVTKAKGGDLGWFQRDKLLVEVADVAFEQEIGKAHGPVETRFGFHIIKPLERREAIPLSEVDSEIRNKLRNDAAEIVMKEIRENLQIERFGETQEQWERLEKSEPPTPMAQGGGAPHGGGPPPHGGGPPPHGAGG
ncbi:MAG: peptidylprolyl isomerase, partial [Myxococcales bacterium]|nr:peptidylprolyl isomerase [Myxococcales bacterium]